MSTKISGLAAEEEAPPLAVAFIKPELEGLCAHVKGIALQSEDSPMEELKRLDPVVTKAPPPPQGLPSLENPTPMDLEEEECHTPRGEEYRIPEVLVCPPAPKRPTRNTLAAALALNAREYFSCPELEEELKKGEGALGLHDREPSSLCEKPR